MNNLDSSAWHRVLTYIEDVDLEVTNSRHQGDVGNRLAEHHPPGYARCYAVWWADATLQTVGFPSSFTIRRATSF